MSQKEALSAFKQLSELTIFQAKKKKAPIQFLGLLEASGCHFDKIWFMGLHDQCLPQKIQFSPFIPIDLQKKLRMPHACHQRELEIAKKLITRIRMQCNELIFSYATFIEERPYQPSPFIVGFESYPAKKILNNAITELERFSESYQIPLTMNELCKGGTSLLAYQAQCPFKAFAAYRLKAPPSCCLGKGLIRWYEVN